jgi:hypothetical protein
MGFDQYHEPPEELPPESRTFARLCASLTEEAEAIGWYEQRLALEPNSVARAVMTNAVGEEYKHFSMDLEFLLRQKPEWREIARRILFQEGDIVAHGEEAEEEAMEDDPTVEVTPEPATGAGAGASASSSGGGSSSSLGIGSLRGRDL